MARKAAWEDMVDSDLGPYGKRSGTRWGRVFVGLLVVATATFVAAYYVPLYRAHQKLETEYRDLNQRSSATTDAAQKAQADLKSVTAERDQFKTEHEQLASQKQTALDQLEHQRADLAAQLDKFVKKGLVTVVSNGTSVLVAFDTAMLFMPLRLEVSPTGRLLLCDVAKNSAGRTMRVSTSLAEATIIPAPLAASYANPWALSAARAAAITQTLEEKCAVPAAQLSTNGAGKQDPFSAPLANMKASAERAVLEVATH